MAGASRYGSMPGKGEGIERPLCNHTPIIWLAQIVAPKRHRPERAAAGAEWRKCSSHIPPRRRPGARPLGDRGERRDRSASVELESLADVHATESARSLRW